MSRWACSLHGCKLREPPMPGMPNLTECRVGIMQGVWACKSIMKSSCSACPCASGWHGTGCPDMAFFGSPY